MARTKKPNPAEQPTTGADSWPRHEDDARYIKAQTALDVATSRCGEAESEWRAADREPQISQREARVRAAEEALAGGPNANDVDWSTETHQAEHDLGGEVYRQEIKISRVGAATYVDEGNRISPE